MCILICLLDSLVMSCMKIGFLLHLMGLCTDLFTSHLSDGTHVSIYVEVKNS